jgi:hypothetical protein
MRRPAPLTREEFLWGLIWTGTAEQLVAAGVIGAEQLAECLQPPAIRGRARLRVTLPSGRTGCVEAPSGRSRRVRVREEYSSDEQAAAAERSARRHLADAERRCWGTPAAARATAYGILSEGKAAIVQAFNLTRTPDRLHQFDEETCAAALGCLIELQRLFSEGTLTVTARPRAQEPGFEAFLRSVLPRETQ